MHQLDPQELPAHTDRLFRAAWALCGSRDEAEDLVQETFVKLLEKRRVVTGGSDLAYLMRALHNTFISTRRAAGSRPQLAAVEVERAPGAIAARAHPETSARVREIFAAIAALPEEFRAAIVAVDVAGLSYSEAAAALKLKESTLSTRVFRARDEVIDRVADRDTAQKRGPRGQPGRKRRGVMDKRTGLPATQSELAAMADGTLAPERRREIENLLTSSDSARESISRQRAAVAMTGELADVPASDALKLRVEEAVAAASGRRRRLPVVAGVAAALAVVALALVLVLPGGGGSAPTVDQVASAAAQGALMPAPVEDPSSPGHLALGVGDVRFPYWGDSHGWEATGARSENVGGRPVNTVFYSNGKGGSMKYSIVSGAPIKALGTGQYYLTKNGDTRRIVWQNGGHTCIIEAQGVDPDELETLIS